MQSVIGRLCFSVTVRIHISSLLPRPPLPEKPVTYPDYQYQLPEVGEEFYFSVFR